MRRLSLTLTLLAALACFTAPVWCEEKPGFGGFGAGSGFGPGNLEQLQRQMMAKFDLNGDGQLDDAEKAKAAAEMQKQLSALDRNGNGKLDPEEVAFAKSLMSRAGQGGGPQYGAGGGGGGGGFGGFGGAGGAGGGQFGGAGGAGGGAFGGAGGPGGGGFGGPGEAYAPKKTRKQRLQEKLDRNGDGKVSKEERAAAAAERKAEQEALKEARKAELERKKAEPDTEPASDEK